jgi:hypothetical protein
LGKRLKDEFVKKEIELLELLLPRYPLQDGFVLVLDRGPPPRRWVLPNRNGLRGPDGAYG